MHSQRRDERINSGRASPAHATQLGLISSRIIATANQAVGTDAVRSVRVPAVGATRAPREAEPAPQAAAVRPAPVKTGDTASPGYQQVMAAHLAVAPGSGVDRASRKQWSGRPGRCAS
ncbi:hypothetical protein GCM10010255_80440 [Streptomyces coeruleofuscus]|uniref:Uncharacterized protein n=1 Tax=Streptomyces coeruleofuscus TaxID=66879 RepID=A0ABN3JDG5_9ACTN